MERRPRPVGQKRILAFGALVIVALLAGFAALIQHNADDTRGLLASRFESRSELLSVFAHDYAAGASSLQPTDTPLQSFFRSAVPTYGGNAFLVDDEGQLVVDGQGEVPADEAILTAPPGLHHLTVDGTRLTVSVVPVEDSPWRTILVGKSNGLYATVDEGQWAPWVLWGTLAVVLFTALWLGVRLNRARGEAHEAARTDLLTELPNRRSMVEVLERQVHQAVRARTEVVVLVLDVDRFKAVNDRHGHAAGDEALRIVAAAIRSALRKGDLLGRWGGEEFLVVLAPTTPEGAVDAADRIRTTVATTSMPFLGADGHCTISGGLAVVVGGDVDGALSAADRALYQAKASGRNRIEVAQSSTVEPQE